MPSVTKTFAFASNLEGITKASPSNPTVTLAHEPSDGSPANGCMKVSINATPGDNGNQVFRSALGPWTDWGVPANVEVTFLQFRFQAKTLDDSSVQTLAVRVIDASLVTVHSAGDLKSDTLPAATAVWTDMGTGPSRAVDFLSQDSSTQVRLELQLASQFGGSGGTAEFRFDTFELTITYDSGSGGDEVPAQIPISNLDGLIFMKGFAYASRIGGTSDAIGMAALQECSIAHAYATAEARGPESLQPLGVGITDETLSGSIRYLVCNAEQFQVFIGGTLAYNGGTGKTTWTKKVNEEPSGFNLHLKSPDDGSDIEAYVYNCLATNQPIIEGSANRDFKVFGVDWRAYGQTTAQGSKLIEVLLPGNQTGAS